MAGLTRLSGSSTGGALPLFPAGDKSSVTPYYTYDQHEGAYVHLPAFTGAANSSSIRILQNSTTSYNATLYDINANAASNGVWASGMTIAEGAGSANADRFVGCYMDETDNFFYMLFSDTSVSPNKLYLSKVNAAGTVTAIGNTTLGNSSMNGLWYGSDHVGPMYRVGGDGSGDFAISMTATASGNSGSGAPNQGVKITIGASDCALSYSTLLPATFGNYLYMRSPTFGPTGNGILAGGINMNSYTEAADSGMYGAIMNTSTGRHVALAHFGSPAQNGYPWGKSSHIIYRARRKYVFSTYSTSFRGTGAVFDEDEVHSWVDKLAEHYGIL